MFGYLTSGFGPNPNTNLLSDSVSDLTPKPATDSDSRPNPKDSVKSTSKDNTILKDLNGLNPNLHGSYNYLFNSQSKVIIV